MKKTPQLKWWQKWILNPDVTRALIMIFMGLASWKGCHIEQQQDSIKQQQDSVRVQQDTIRKVQDKAEKWRMRNDSSSHARDTSESVIKSKLDSVIKLLNIKK